MSNYESFLPLEGGEKPEPIEVFGSEFVGETEIGNFEQCELLTNKEVAGYISENIPPSHTEGCPSIEYDPHNSSFRDSPNTLAFFETGSHQIKIGPSERFYGGSEGMLQTVTHEIGHNVHWNMMEQNPILAVKWEAISNLSGFNEYVSPYASTSIYEDFAESYQVYIRDPGFLEFVSPEKYAFMRDHVFNGREYWNS